MRLKLIVEITPLVLMLMVGLIQHHLTVSVSQALNLGRLLQVDNYKKTQQFEMNLTWSGTSINHLLH